MLETFMEILKNRTLQIKETDGYSMTVKESDISFSTPYNFDKQRQSVFIYHTNTTIINPGYPKSELETTFNVDIYKPIHGRFGNKQVQENPLIKKCNEIYYDIIKAINTDHYSGQQVNGILDDSGNTIAAFYFLEYLPEFGEGQNPYCGSLCSFNFQYSVSNLTHT